MQWLLILSVFIILFVNIDIIYIIFMSYELISQLYIRNRLHACARLTYLKVLHAVLRFLPILGRVICCMYCLSFSK